VRILSFGFSDVSDFGPAFMNAIGELRPRRIQTPAVPEAHNEVAGGKRRFAVPPPVSVIQYGSVLTGRDRGDTESRLFPRCIGVVRHAPSMQPDLFSPIGLDLK
jgi:hypothetical protein